MLRSSSEVPSLPPSPGWGEACAWEWGGVVEPVPLPCADPYLGKVLGAATPFLVLAVVFACLVVGLLIVIAIKSGR